jgi:hypothetical protein
MEKDFAALREIDGDLFKSLFHRARLGLFLLCFHSIYIVFLIYLFHGAKRSLFLLYLHRISLISPSQLHSPIPIASRGRLVESTRKGI